MTEQEAEVIEKVLDVDFAGDDLDRACIERLRNVAKGNGYESQCETLLQLLDIVDRLLGA